MRIQRATKITAVVVASGACVLLVGCAAQRGALNAGETKAGCASLVTPITATQIGVPSGAASIDSAALVAAGALAVAERGPTPEATVTPATPEYCKVLGSIAPRDPAAPPIPFQVNP